MWYLNENIYYCTKYLVTLHYFASSPQHYINLMYVDSNEEEVMECEDMLTHKGVHQLSHIYMQGKHN